MYALFQQLLSMFNKVFYYNKNKKQNFILYVIKL